jgi:hypothetical protein
MGSIETDYLVVGAGAAGMAFVDALIAEADVDVVMVDRRHSAGGHWNDAYRFVRLHQPSANYGVNSRMLGTDAIDTSGPNVGFYERATGVEICDYFRRVMDDHLLPFGRVRFFGMCDYTGDWLRDHSFTSLLTGKSTEVRVRRKIVDTTYLQVSVPATHTPSFDVDDDAHFVPVGDLVDLAEPPSGYTILGAGKTAMDACVWLLENGVDPDRIRWIKPREAWVFDRAAFQPLDLMVESVEGFAGVLESLAHAESVDDLFRRLEDGGHLHRIDTSVEPTMFRGAILSEDEREGLRRIDRVVRLGRIRHLGPDKITLEDGTIPTDRREVHVDCTASGFRTAPAVPIFEPGRITLQSLIGGFTTYNAALVGFVEAARDDDAEKNRLCPPTPQPSVPIDWIATYCAAFRNMALHMAEPDVTAWQQQSRLSATRGMDDHLDDPRMQSAMARWFTNLEAALANGERFLEVASSMAEAAQPAATI